MSEQISGHRVHWIASLDIIAILVYYNRSRGVKIRDARGERERDEGIVGFEYELWCPRQSGQKMLWAPGNIRFSRELRSRVALMYATQMPHTQLAVTSA